jgi:hypothetical protein
MLSEELKRKRMAASLENVCRCQDEGEYFVKGIVTGDETWVYGFIPEKNRNSMTLKLPYSLIAK